MNNTPTTEERVWAILSHLSAILFGIGMIIPLMGWSEQRRKSNYATFHALQALGYQSLGYTVWLLVYLLLIVLLVVFFTAGAIFFGQSESAMNSVMGIWFALFFLVIFGSLGLYFILPIIAAIACGFGRDFRYPIMGSRLEHYLCYDPTRSTAELVWFNEEHETHWVAAMGHFSVIIMLWGMLAPLTVLLMRAKNNVFLKFQSIQTLMYHALTVLLFIIGIFLYMFGIFSSIALMGITNGPTFKSPLGTLGIVILFSSISIFLLIMLIIPLFHILGQWAGYRVLKGDNYHYPLIGRLAEKWFIRQDQSIEETS
jgi:uncharacterized Tic20 family protein